MIEHLPYDPVCTVCGLGFIPWAPEVLCPRCNQPAIETCDDFVSRSVAILQSQRERWGRFSPPYQGIWTLSDAILACAAKALDSESARNRARQRAEALWEGDPIIRSHIGQLVEAIAASC